MRRRELYLLEEAAQEFSDKSVVLHAKKLIKYRKKSFDEFMTPSDDCIYGAEPYCNPDEHEESYIVKTFDDAIVMIKNYLKYYRDIGVKDNINSRYNILKKKRLRA